MQIALKQYPGFNLPQTMRGMEWISEVVMVLMHMVMKMPPPTPRRSVSDDGLDFPFSDGLGAAGSALSRSRRGLSPPSLTGRIPGNALD